MIEFDTIEFTDDEDIDNIVRCLITKIQDSIRECHEFERFASFEKSLEWSHDIIRLQKHLRNLRINRTILVEHVVFFLIFFVALEESHILEIHEFAAHRVNLLVQFSTQFTYKKPRCGIRDNIFDNEFLEKFDARARPKKSCKVQSKPLRR